MAERRVEFCALVVVGLLMGCSFVGLLSEATYVLSSIQEYPNKQGFEAELELIQHTTNLTLGPDITPLHFIVRYRQRDRDTEREPSQMSPLNPIHLLCEL
jgi:hypothetical protein